MKVVFKKYPNWIGPYQIADSLKYIGIKEVTRDKIGDYLANKTPLAKWCEYIYAVRNKKRTKVKVHNYDAWNAFETLSIVILPVLKELKRQKQGAGFVADEDVPEELRSTSAPPKEHEWDTDDNWFKRWEWVIDQMIWSFEQLQPDYDWEDQYWIVKPEIDMGNHPEDEGKEVFPLRWKVKGELDTEGYDKHNQQINNGLILFGKYFRGLWD